MDSKKYIDAFNEIKFTEDIENRILDVILSDDNSLEKQSKRRHRHWYQVLAAGCILIVTIFMIVHLFTPHLTCDLLNDESIQSLSKVKRIETISVISNNGIYMVDYIEIEKNEMLIFHNENEIKKGNSITFIGKLKGNDLKCEIGYIFCGIYQRVTDISNDNNINISITAEESGLYSWCIVNYSKSDVGFRGELSVNQKDLIYRYYGENAVYADKNTVFIFSSLGKAIIDNEEAVYAFNCSTGTVYKISNELSDFRYKVQEEGYYLVQIITKDGTYVDLSNYITIEIEIPGNEMEEDIIGL